MRELRSMAGWFAMTSQERLFVLVVVTIALIGLAARYYHLKHQKSAPYPATKRMEAAGEW